MAVQWLENKHIIPRKVDRKFQDTSGTVYKIRERQSRCTLLFEMRDLINPQHSIHSEVSARTFSVGLE